MKSNFLEKKVIVRGDRSGVYYGTLEAKDGHNARLTNARKIWYWAGAATINQLAVDGTSKKDNCKFTVYVPSVEISDEIETILCTEKAIESIESVKPWTAQ
jgi:hypothetical protein